MSNIHGVAEDDARLAEHYGIDTATIGDGSQKSMPRPLDKGGSAFPNNGAWANGVPDGGMTLRDYFAGQALPQLIAVAYTKLNSSWFIDWPDIAHKAYQYADAMLAERSKQI